jgi:hypothetical protein
MISKTASVQFRYGIVCDDARREDNGKLLLVGVYAGNIIVPRFPATLLLCLVIAVDAAGPYEVPLELRVKFDRRIIMTGKATLKSGRAGLSLAITKGLLLEDLQGPGMLAFQAKPSQGRWATLSTTLLEQGAG